MASLLRPAGRARLWRRLVRHHLPLAGVSAIATLSLAAGLRPRPPLFPLSLATGYVALGLLGVTLLLGPLKLLRGRPNPVSTDLRRDIGIWAALFGLAHVVLGLQNHMGGRILRYFMEPAHGPLPLRLRVDLFGLANHVGLVATLLLTLLLALSNDRSLRALGRHRWKAIQRLNYGLFVLVVLHSIAYQLLERRSLPWVLALALMGGAVLAGQLAGYRRQAHGTAEMRLDASAAAPEDG